MSTLLLAASLFLSAVSFVSADETTYGQNAICASERLMSWYNAPNGVWHDYWWESANMMSSVADLAALDPDYGSTHADMFSSTLANAPGALGYANFINNFYDDEAWWALAWVNVYDLTQDGNYLNVAKTIWHDMHDTGTDIPCGSGGIWWSKDKKYISSISNELYMQLSAALANRVAEDDPDKVDLLAAAEGSWDWFMQTGLLGGDGLVVDGLDPATCKPEGQVFSYNQGVILGAAVELAGATGNSSYLDVAGRIADAVTTPNATLTDENGILVDGCDRSLTCAGDGEDFSGPFIKNLKKLQLARHQDSWKAFIVNQAQSIWKNNVGMTDEGCNIGAFWQGPYHQADPSTQSDGLDALNAAIAVTR